MVAVKFSKTWNRFWAFASGASISIKIMGIVLILILILGLGITFQVRNNLTTTLTHELEKQGISIAKHVAAHSTEPILMGNYYDLYQLTKDSVENEDDVRYVLILDTDDNIVTHSFDDGTPVGLVTANQIGADDEFKLVRLDTNEGMILDIAVPIFGGRAGVARIGMTTQSLHETVATLTRNWILITGIVSLVGVLIAYSLTTVLTRPIKHLVDVTKAIAKGDLKRKAPVWAHDEIGGLGVAFNTMTEALAKTRTQREAFQAELLRRNLELATLNAITTNISGSRELDDIMNHSLLTILKFFNLRAGWVNILTNGEGLSATVCHTGLPPEVVKKIDSHNFSSCRCSEAIDRKLPIIVDDDENCPVLHGRFDGSGNIRCHVTAPLICKSQVIGLLHIAGLAPSQFTSENIKFLGAVGYQMGVAIENAKLWSELKRKEEIRGSLLGKIISAQEAERKRISRELHDQTGQSLTSVMVGLRTLEDANEQEIRQRIADMRQIMAQTLDEVHNLALELRPSSLDDLGLIKVLELYVSEYAKKFGVNTDFQAIGFGKQRLSPEAEIALYRIVQEALTNVVKHAEAKEVIILLRIRNSSVIAIIEDNGKGFDIRKDLGLPSFKHHLGLHGMYERAELIGGKVTIESKRGTGTTIFVEIPLQGNERL